MIEYLSLIHIPCVDIEQEFSEDFIKNMIAKLDLVALKSTALSLGIELDFELTTDTSKLTSDNFKALHSFLLEVRSEILEQDIDSNHLFYTLRKEFFLEICSVQVAAISFLLIMEFQTCS